MNPDDWQRAKELFAAALQRPPGERSQFLATACSDDNVRREVETLLTAYESQFLERPVIGNVAETILNLPGTNLAPGEHVSHFEIVRLIGAGGMSEVYLAQDTRLKRNIALKVLAADLIHSRERLHRFEQEARAAATLNHPNVAHIYEVGEVKGTAFIAMELIDGQTLGEKIHRDQTSLERLLEWLAQVADGLAKAHAVGIVHRDLKPDNIMISRDGYAKILDFGLAKLLAPQKSESGDGGSEAATAMLPQPLSTPGMILGTVGYISPEQAGGRAQIDARSDIFSFGCILFEAATKQQPFPGETVAASLHKTVHEQPPPIKDFNPAAAIDLQRVVRRCLEKDPDDRYQTIEEVATELRDLLREIQSAPETKLSISPKTTNDSRTFGPSKVTIRGYDKTRSSVEYLVGQVRQHKLGAAIVFALLVTVAFGIVYFRRPAAGKATIETIAVMPFVNDSGSADLEYLTDGVTETLINSLKRLPHLSVKERSSVFRYKGKEVDSQKVAAELSVQAVITGRVVQRGDGLTLYISLVDGRDGTQLWGEQYDRKMTDLVALQNEIARDVSQRLRLRLASPEEQQLKPGTENPEAYQAYLKGWYLWRRGYAPGFEKSRDFFQQAVDIDPNYARAYSALADYYGFALAVGFLPPNEKNWQKAATAVNKALALDDTLAETHNPQAAVNLYYYRDWPAAERAFKRGINLNPNFAEIHIHYAMILALFGRNDEALGEVQRALEIEPFSSRFNYFKARILFFTGDNDRAIDELLNTLDLEPNYVPALEMLGYAYEKRGRQKEAIADWSKALTITGAGEQASILERVYAKSGFEAAVRAVVQDQLKKLNEKVKRGGYVPASEYVTAYTRLSDKEQAIAWLDKAMRERNSFVFEVRKNPIYDELRRDPRFQDLLRREGL